MATTSAGRGLRRRIRRRASNTLTVPHAEWFSVLKRETGMETDQLAELVVQKRAILTQIQGLAERQAQLVREGDIGRLVSLLAAKQLFLDHLQKVEKQIEPFRSQNPEQREWRSPELRRQVRQAATESEKLLQQIMHAEQECESQLIHRCDDAAARLQGIHDSAQTRTAYLQSGQPPSRRLDIGFDF